MPYPETIAYIKKQLEDGFNPAKIRAALEDAGYQGSVIDILMKEAGAVEERQRSHKSIESVIFKDLTVALILLAVTGSVVYVGFLDESTPLFLSSPEPVSLDFGSADDFTLAKRSSILIDLNPYVSNPDYSGDAIYWFYQGQQCLDISLDKGILTVTSTYTSDAGCPSTEKLLIDALDPEGRKASAYLTFKIS